MRICSLERSWSFATRAGTPRQRRVVTPEIQLAANASQHSLPRIFMHANAVASGSRPLSASASRAEDDTGGPALPHLATPESFVFPYPQPYAIQLDLMRTVFTAIEDGKIAIVGLAEGKLGSKSCRLNRPREQANPSRFLPLL